MAENNDYKICMAVLRGTLQCVVGKIYDRPPHDKMEDVLLFSLVQIPNKGQGIKFSDLYYNCTKERAEVKLSDLYDFKEAQVNVGKAYLSKLTGLVIPKLTLK